MGLRERNAAQTRDLIWDTALPMFLEHGYESTTMEEIAARAQIGTSTLYRYFPSKDLIVTEPIAIRGQMAAELRARPAQEPLDLALGHALRALVATPRPHPDRLRQIFAVLDTAAGPQARLRESFDEERSLLQAAVAERLGRPADDLFCVMSARVTILVLELMGDGVGLDSVGADTSTAEAALDRVRELLGQLNAHPPVLPRLD